MRRECSSSSLHKSVLWGTQKTRLHASQHLFGPKQRDHRMVVRWKCRSGQRCSAMAISPVDPIRLGTLLVVDTRGVPSVISN